MYSVQDVYLKLRTRIFDALDAEAVSQLASERLKDQLRTAVDTLVDKEAVQIPVLVRYEFVDRLMDEIKGFGPLQPLIDDDDISDIMVNGSGCVYVERKGKLSRTDVTFIDESQLLGIAKRIAALAGRRVDESQPLCDARLPDGSRVNIAIPPITLDGSAISIRKFGRRELSLEQMVNFGTLSIAMARVLAVAASCRLNILISGGTGSGKTTLLNALSKYISDSERVITIEDAAELKLQQPHVVRMETRPPGIENTGCIDQRDLVINSLRMRPDRIIVGECRGGEAFEMLQAMNTGHDGSMSTLHANTPRDALARVESMVMMAAPNLPLESIRRNITSAVDLIVQVSRLHDGSRKIISISEVIGMEGDSVVMEEVFRFEPSATQPDQMVTGQFTTAGLMGRSALRTKARFFGMEETLEHAFQERQL
ncbi:pilus assembly protein CpaF [Endozoicomonas montiporae]|uniref:Pilus assembly protein CpaF n=2 Tax=Endozoicomonas montiporae TaxID=1027273 RepID=A0A081N732_9GAMM|nr:CpaF family protein [Endozoicomonas montiporae]AMO55928.1 pilus assembly protein, ATPase CpaF [Endozoicomonas montiporae CL-33]KEQ14255.1 pilus assembly protein CpaF [Endozoicomonas montiporae]